MPSSEMLQILDESARAMAFQQENLLEPRSANVGTEKAARKQRYRTIVPTVPMVPTDFDKSQETDLDQWYDQEEGAAITVYDDGL